MMKRNIHEKSVEDFCDRLYYEFLVKKEMCVIAKYDAIIDILNCLIKNYDYFRLKNLRVTEPDYAGYVKEYILEVDDLGEIWIQEAENKENSYYNIEASVAYIHGDCNNAITNHVSDDYYVFTYGDNEKETDEDVLKDDGDHAHNTSDLSDLLDLLLELFRLTSGR